MMNGQIQSGLPAHMYGNGTGLEFLGGNLFAWITLTMVWVLMILAIMALLKYVTHEGEPKGRGKAKASKE